MRVLADFYTIPGMKTGQMSTDDFILGMRSGIISDVSVGFYGGDFRCSLCGLDYWRGCRHIAGETYERRDEQGEVIGKERAFVWIDDAHLSEVSAVYDGATPGAAILKAQQESEAGRLSPQHARLIEARYRIKLPAAQRFFAGSDVTRPQENPMPEEPQRRPTRRRPNRRRAAPRRSRRLLPTARPRMSALSPLT